MIPDAAVEAAAIEWVGKQVWQDCNHAWRADYMERTRAMLEAAAPHMLAPLLALHPKTCEINGDNTDCKDGACPMLVCGPCGESWPCPTVAALGGTLVQHPTT